MYYCVYCKKEFPFSAYYICPHCGKIGKFGMTRKRFKQIVIQKTLDRIQEISNIVNHGYPENISPCSSVD